MTIAACLLEAFDAVENTQLNTLKSNMPGKNIFLCVIHYLTFPQQQIGQTLQNVLRLRLLQNVLRLRLLLFFLLFFKFNHLFFGNRMKCIKERFVLSVFKELCKKKICGTFYNLFNE